MLSVLNICVSDPPPCPIGGAVGAAGSVLFTFLVGMLWTHYALLIFLASGSAYILTLFAFQWRAPATLRTETISAD